MLNDQHEIRLSILPRSPGASSNDFICNLLISFGFKYEESHRSSEYVLDLIIINIRKFLVVEEEEQRILLENTQKHLKVFLHEFVKRNSLQNKVVISLIDQLVS